MPAPRGLKVGDTFKEGELTYEVTKVVGDNYEAKRVTGVQLPFCAPEDEVKGEESKTDYQSMPYFELKKICASKGINPNGKKDELIARLTQ